MRRGITLVELLVASVMFALIAVSLSQVLYFVIRYEMDAPKAREAAESKIQFQDSLTQILQSAYLSSTATDNTTYLIGTSAGQNPNSGGAGGTTQSNINLNPGQTSDGIVLTINGQRVAQSYMNVTDTDLANLNQQYGAQGGVEEIAISMTPVADPGDKTGLYIREQRPADSDYTQGGYERVFSPDVHSIGFEFYDGTEWVGSWDTTAGASQRRLPAAIRVSYSMTDDPNTTHVFVVQLPLSDVTPNNPVANGGTTTTGGTTSGVRPAPQPKRGVSPPPRFDIGGTLPLFENLSVVPDGSQPVALNSAAPSTQHAASNAPQPSLEEWAITSDFNPKGKTAATAPLESRSQALSTKAQAIPTAKVQTTKPAEVKK